MATVTVNGSTKIEEEQAMIIRADDPQAVIDKIADLTELSWLKLKKAPNQFITDTYLNTKDRSIKQSMRIRNLNGEDFITIKGKNLSLNGASQRQEFEVKWPWEDPSVWDVAELFDLRVTQQRSTDRVVRDIYVGKDHVAELALDKVTYYLDDDNTATFFEAEVELKGKKKVKLDDIVKIFTKKFPELKKWKSSKFATGTALDVALGIRTDENGTVTDDSIDNLAILLNLIS